MRLNPAGLLVLVSAICFALVGTSVPSTADTSDREVIAMVVEGSLVMPSGEDSCTVAGLQSVTVEIQTALLASGVELVRRAFPDFNLADTLGVATTGEVVSLTNWSHAYIFRLPTAADVDSLVSALSGLSDVVYAEPCLIATSATQCPVLPNDAAFQGGQQWNLNSPSDHAAFNDVDAPEAWCLTTGSSIMIGILDNGVDDGHQDLAGKVSGELGVHPGDEDWRFGHGTHVAGIAAAIGDNGFGIAGLNWDALIDTRRIDNTNVDEKLARITASANAGSRVLNNSWKMSHNSWTVRFGFADVYSRNVVAVAAMGNDNSSSPVWPAAFGQGIIAVGATNQAGTRWVSSPTFGSNTGDHIDVVAPGQGIYSTEPYTSVYGYGTGTSAAAPHVTGLAALLLSYDPSLYNDDIEEILKRSAHDKGAAGWDPQYGYGIVKGSNAFEMIRAPNSLLHQSAYGGTQVGSTHIGNQIFLRVPGLNTSPHPADRYEVRRTVTFPAQYVTPPEVWGRGVPTVGFSAAQPNWGMGWCEPVDGTVTTTGCVLRTFVYEVFTVYPGNSLGYFPSVPAAADFAYTVVGDVDDAPVVNVSYPNGGATHRTGDFVDIQWNVTDEDPEGTSSAIFLTEYHQPTGITFVWDVAWNQTVNGQGSGDFLWHIWTGLDTIDTHKIRVVTTDAHGNQGDDDSNNYFTIEYRKKGGPAPPIPMEQTAQVPEIAGPNFLQAPSPNPFNPSTNIRFGLSKGQRVILGIFDATGRQVRMLHRDVPLGPGEHVARWDGRDDQGRQLASGVYFVRIRAGSFAKTTKAVLLK